MSQVTRRVCASLCQAVSHMMCDDEGKNKEGARWESYSDSRVSQPRYGTISTMNRGRMKSTGTARMERESVETRSQETRDERRVASFY
jgi:hypothetical protein